MMHSDPLSDRELRWGERTLRQRNMTIIHDRNYSPTSAGSQRCRSASQRTLFSVCMVLSNSTPENPGFHWFTPGKTVAFGKELTNKTWPGTDTTYSPPLLPWAHENLRLFSPWPQQVSERKTVKAWIRQTRQKAIQKMDMRTVTR